MSTEHGDTKLLQKGIDKELIHIDEKKNLIIYLHEKQRRKWSNPEEKIQAVAYCKLALEYNYPLSHIGLYESIQIGSSTREADIVIYDDEKRENPLIITECKSADTSDAAFRGAVRQAFSYAVAYGAKYVWVTSGIKDEYYEVSEERPRAHIVATDIPRYGQNKLADYKYVYDADNAPDGQKYANLKEVEQYELTQKFKRAHDALWAGGELDPSAAFDELDKLIFCKLWDEKKEREPGERYDFQIIPEKNDNDTGDRTAKALAKRIEELYEEGRQQDPEVFREGIRLSPHRIMSVVQYLQDTNLSETDLDSKGRAFETFMGSFFRGDFGQFFTPREMVDFIVDALPIKNTSKVLDTSCGSGGFLLRALDKVRRQADAAFPSRDNARIFKRHHDYWHTFASKNLFGIEVNEQIARVAKMNMILHDDGHTNVVTADGLLSPEELSERVRNKGFKKEHFDFIITNPPFGATIFQVSRAYYQYYSLTHKEVNWLEPKSMRTMRPAQSTEVLFIEQCHNYLREGGYLAIVLPDGVLTNSSLQYVRDKILQWFRLVAVVSMPQTAFMPTGAGVKSSIVFLRKHAAKETIRIEDTRSEIEETLLRKEKYEAYIQACEDEKKDVLANLRGFAKRGNFDELTSVGKKAYLRDIKKTAEYKEWSNNISAEWKEKIEAKKSAMIEARDTIINETIMDYPIFMAIAEDIGYDATGRKTGKNELEDIGKKLVEFIGGIEKGHENFLT